MFQGIIMIIKIKVVSVSFSKEIALENNRIANNSNNTAFMFYAEEIVECYSRR